MKVLQVNVVYGSGSTGQITATLHRGLIKKGINAKVYYGRTSAETDTGVTKLIPEQVCKLQSLRSKMTGYAYAGCVVGTNALIRAIEKEKPDIVHLQCINGYFVNIYRTLDYLKKNQIRTVLTLHAEFMYTANCGHAFECEGFKTGCGLCDRKNPERPVSWFFDRSKEEWKRMQEAFYGFETLEIAAVSDWLKMRAGQSPFFKEKDIAVIYNGVDTTVFHFSSGEDIRKQYGLEDKKVLLYVTPDFNFPLKGGKYILELAKQIKDPKIRILMVGKNLPSDVPENVIKLPYVESKEHLAVLYCAADVTLLASRRETFSMVCAESLCCGTPVAGFLAGGPESIAIPEYSCFVPYGDTKALQEAAEQLLNREQQKNQISSVACEKYSTETMVEKYLLLYQKMMQGI